MSSSQKSVKPWFAVREPLSQKRNIALTFLSFLMPILIWSALSYLPFLWHPKVEITDQGSISWLQLGSLIDKSLFEQQQMLAEQKSQAIPQGIPANPIYLPAPHEVVIAFYTAFTTEPKRRSEQWLHESLWHSITIVFWGFALSTLIGLPLGILCGTYSVFNKLFEPFIEFFRYLPAPAFGALAVAVLGIYDGPKIAIIFIGTFFQQVLVIANTTRKLDIALLEAALTLGAKNINLLFRVVIPGILPNLFKDLRILLGWAWTYLIVAELIGTSSGITWFITQQARYKNFENVFAAIIMIGIIGLLSDLILAAIGRRLFSWENSRGKIA